MPDKSNEIKAGIFVFSSIVILIIFIIAMTGSKLWYPKDEYYILMRFAGGIEPGVPIRYGGIKVGEVEDIKIYDKDNSKIKATLNVMSKTPIKDDSEAFINSLGIMGEYYIEITTGTDTSAILPQKNFIAFKEIHTMSEISEDLKIIEEQIKILLSNIDSNIKNLDFNKISNLISSLEENVSVYSKDFSKTLKNLSDASSKLASLIERVDGNFGKNSEQFESTMKNLDDVLNKSIGLVEDMSETIQTLNKTMMISGKNFEETMNNINKISRNLKDFSSTIRDKPWTIVRKSYREEKKK